ncbi:MAG: hypothetical protein KKF80_08240 [Candidatus Omnitrophica bacterium]|nr:hypothetical protein [Candidatus Omnitrophota bacterium]
MKETFLCEPIKEVINKRPYVVSGDIKCLLQQWAYKKNFRLPNDEFFDKLRSNFSLFMIQVFPEFEFVTEKELVDGLNALVKKNGLPTLSLDRVYFPSDVRIDIARQIDIGGVDKGLGRRADSPFLLEQFRKLRDSGVKEVSLVDDVIFSGDLIARVGKVLKSVGINVGEIYAGIGIKEGMDLLKNKGYRVGCVRSYESVIDEICERDFYPGVPLSGRLVDSENNVGAPYILPFGNPGKWASVPQNCQIPFSRFCLNQTVQLFEGIEKISNRIVTCADLERKVVSLPQDGTRFIDALLQQSL